MGPGGTGLCRDRASLRVTSLLYGESSELRFRGESSLFALITCATHRDNAE